MIDTREWTEVIRRGAKDDECLRIIRAINEISAARRANVASIIVTCAQILGQSIVNADADISAEVRTGIMQLIDDYAMHATLLGPPD